MRKQRHGDEKKENHERWLLTYADLITLLMIFFVVLWSISKLDSDKFKAVAESLSRALGGGTPAKMEISSQISGPNILENGNYPTQSQPKDSNSEQAPGNKGQQGNADQENMTILDVKAKLDKFAAENGLETRIVSSVVERGLVVSIQDTVLFDSGSASITPSAHTILNKISTVLASTPNYIKVEGYTDNVPMHNAQIPSNWELSVLRATHVLKLLISEGGIDPSRLSATGYGEYRPKATNATVEGRARNRRVDLVILRSKYDITEPGKGD